MARYWWQCTSCGDRPAWLTVCPSRSIAAFIWDELAPSGWDQSLLRRRCICKRRSLRNTAVAETFSLVTRFDTSGQWAETAKDGKPRYRCGPMGFPNSDVYTAERLMLPLSADGTQVDHIFGAIFYAPLKRSQFSPTAVVGILEC